MVVGVNSSQDKESLIQNITHPDYDAMVIDWEKYRLAYESGRPFVDKYLERFSSREDSTDFDNRKSVTYVPAHAKAAVNDVKNAIYQRFVDISRKDGPLTYQQAITGINGGVDLQGNSMNGFIGRVVLPELLVMSKVGIFIDKPRLPEGATLSEQMSIRPYLYMYKAEQIRSWTYNNQNILTGLLLQDIVCDVADEWGVMYQEIEGYRLIHLKLDGVHIRFFDAKGKESQDEVVLNLTRIPFVLGDISTSLMTDISDYQIALMNLASSDLMYAMKSNFPFYTEQYYPAAEHLALRQADASDTDSYPGTSEEAQIAREKEIKVGSTKGRRYAKGLERPGFVHPSSEPLEASMRKQEQMKQEIRQLINLNLTNVEPRRASAEAKAFDERGLESGLSFIGLELEYVEREVARIWAEYENRRKPDAATIYYPKTYSLRSEGERQAEADMKIKQAAQVPSNTYRKEMMKEVADLTIGTKVSEQTLLTIKTEIDSASVVLVDPTTIREDVEQGLVTRTTASGARGYPEGEVAKAEEEHAKRLARIAISQSEGMAARGVPDLDPEGTKGAKNARHQTIS
jgi:hypothetical protein